MLVRKVGEVALGSIGVIGASSIVWFANRPTPILEPTSVQKRLEFINKYEHKDDSWLMSLTRGISIFPVSCMARMFLKLNDVTYHDGEKLYQHLEHRKPGQALITVANHTSTIDDPVLMAGFIPMKYWLPSKMRWGLCTQEICFQNNILGAFFGSGKALPIARGHGVLQEAVSKYIYRLHLSTPLVHIHTYMHILQYTSIHPSIHLSVCLYIHTHIHNTTILSSVLYINVYIYPYSSKPI